MKLSYDTLLHIISLSLNVQDTVQLIATCRLLYHEGPKVALKKVVIISTEEQLASFLKFLRADNSSRCRYLRQLELFACSPEPDVVQELIDTIPLLINIEYLRLIDADELLELDPALTATFSAITSLRHLNFDGVQGGACELLCTLQSPLISANIDFLACDIIFWDLPGIDRRVYHPVTVLRNFSSTLEELQCTAWYTPSDRVVPDKVYPNMRKLSIEWHEFPLRIDPFIRAFPNLTHLYVKTDGSYSEDIRESHYTNVAQQLDPVESCGTWTHLEHFSGCLCDLYVIGLTSHIPRITIIDRLDDGPRTNSDMLATMLRYARPFHLKLEGTSSMLGDSNRGFISMLQGGSSANLINLDVCIYFGEDDREKDLAAFIDNLVSVLTGLPLKFLELRFEADGLEPKPEGPSPYERILAREKGLPGPPERAPAPFTPAELSLQSLDMDGLIARLEAVPSLDAAHIVVPGSRYRGNCDWKGHDRTSTKGTSRLAGHEQWKSWLPGKNRVQELERPSFARQSCDTF